jgi:hypothetical protein
MSSSESLLSYSDIIHQNVKAINDLIEGNAIPDTNHKVIPPIQDLGGMDTTNFFVDKQNGIDILNDNNKLPSSSFKPDDNSKQNVVITPENNDKLNYIVMVDKPKHRYNPLVMVNDDYIETIPQKLDLLKFTKKDEDDKDEKILTDSLISSFYIGSITVVGLYIVYRMIQRSK